MHWVEDVKTMIGVALAIAAFGLMLPIVYRTRPKPAAAPPGPDTFMHLVAGRPYKLIRPFTDFGGITHVEGETFIFQGHAFLPDEDGLTLFTDKGAINLQWRPEAQGEIINALEDYLAEA